MGPVSDKSYAGRALARTKTLPAERAKQDIDYGRRAKGYIFGAFCPAAGEAFTQPSPGRGSAHWVGFLEHVETWIPRTTERIYAIMDNLSSHRTTDVLLFVLGDGVPAQVRGLSQSDRAVVEGPALSRISGPAV
jgi:hypothetical protein